MNAPKYDCVSFHRVFFPEDRVGQSPDPWAKAELGWFVQSGGGRNFFSRMRNVFQMDENKITNTVSIINKTIAF